MPEILSELGVLITVKTDWGWEALRWWEDESAEGAYAWYERSHRLQDLPLASCIDCGWRGENHDSKRVGGAPHGPDCRFAKLLNDEAEKRNRPRRGGRRASVRDARTQERSEA